MRDFTYPVVLKPDAGLHPPLPRQVIVQSVARELFEAYSLQEVGLKNLNDRTERGQVLFQ